MNSLFPFRILRYITDIGLPEAILDSARYVTHRRSLFQEVMVSPSDEDWAFRGYWIVRNSITDSLSDEPSTSDIVILYLHGGGYFCSSPATYLLFLLRLAETILRNGQTVSIFALDYDLAPEHHFPRQLDQAREAYNWLLKDIGVSAEKVVIMGDSAGGHLALSLLVDQYQRSQDLSTSRKPKLVKPAGLILLSPWLSLHHQPDSYTRNEMTDELSGPFLQDVAVRFLGPENCSPWPNRSPLFEFLDANPSIEWDSVLPSYVWVAAGKNEIMYDDIVRWVKDREGDCKGRDRINAELDQDKPHVYAWFETMDVGLRKKFLNLYLEDEKSHAVFEAVDRIGKAVMTSLGRAR